MNMKLNNRDFTHIEMLLALAILSLIVAIGMSVYDGSYSFFSSIRRHTRSLCDWSSDVCSSDLLAVDPRAEFFQGDLADIEAIKLALRESKAEAVMHFAANALVGESMTNPGKYFRNNVSAGVNLLDAAVEAGVKKFIFSSTCATYGTPEKIPMDERLPDRKSTRLNS